MMWFFYVCCQGSMTALAQAREILMCNQAYVVGVICPSPDWDRFNVPEKLGVTVVVLVNSYVVHAYKLPACFRRR